MFRQYSAGDVNLRGILLMFGTFFSIAAPATAIARVLPVCVGDVIFFIFGRRLWRCSVLTPLLLFEQLKKAKEEMSKKSREKIPRNRKN
jgi:hypothetical protein